MKTAAIAFLASVFALMLHGCGVAPPAPLTQPNTLGQSPWATSSVRPEVLLTEATATARWQHYPLPGKAPTQFSYAYKDGRDALAVLAKSSASMVRKAVRVEPAQLGQLRFSWQVPDLIAQADLAQKDADDSPVRIILAFEGDRSRFSARDAMLSELARAVTGEEMPYATLMYVWCNSRPAGTVIPSPRTDRIRRLVVESGRGQLNHWLDYERDIRADYERAFGEPPGALVGIGIMTDTDNTRTVAKAWYGPVRLASPDRLDSPASLR